jgi:hypothetical protein
MYAVFFHRFQKRIRMYVYDVYPYYTYFATLNILYVYLYVFNINLICRYGVSILGPIRIKQSYKFPWKRAWEIGAVIVCPCV